jgi:hypothetical protein
MHNASVATMKQGTSHKTERTQAARQTSATPVSAVAMRWRRLRFRSSGIFLRSRRSAIQGTPRFEISVAIELQTVQRFVWVTQISGSNRIRAPRSDIRYPNSISSMLGLRYRSSKPSTSKNQARRTAPHPLQNVSAARFADR